MKSFVNLPPAILLGPACTAHGRNVVNTALQGNGEMARTTDTTGLFYRIEWTSVSSSQAIWRADWRDLVEIDGGTNTTLKAAMPMCFRIVATPSRIDVSGTWSMSYAADGARRLRNASVVLLHEGITILGGWRSGAIPYNLSGTVSGTGVALSLWDLSHTTFIGTVSGDSIEGLFSDMDGDTGKFTLIRQ